MPLEGVRFLATVLVKDLIEAGVHFGHRASRWNPKMRPYIYARRNLIHIIDVRETIRGLLRARKYLQQVAAPGQPDPVRRHQAAGVATPIEQQGAALRHALRQRPLAGRHADQFPHDSQPARPSGGAGSPAGQRRAGHLLEEDAVGADPRVPQDVPQPQRHADHEPAARVPGGHRPAEGEERRSREARKLGITTVALIDTDCDPDEVDLPIPGNDDSIRSIELIVQLLADAVLAGKVGHRRDEAGTGRRGSRQRELAGLGTKPVRSEAGERPQSRRLAANHRPTDTGSAGGAIGSVDV